MYRTRKKLALITINICAVLLFLLVALALLPEKTSNNISYVTLALISAIFVTVIFLFNKARSYIYAKIKHDTLETGETVIINQFID